MIPKLAPDEVHTWCVRLDAPRDVSAGLYATLSPDERNRSARFRFDRVRQRFVIAHGALRDLLGHYVGSRHNEFGKPELGPDFGLRPRFNLSHSAELALIAIAADVEVGVDVERVRMGMHYDEIARRFFSAEEVDELSRVPGQLHAKAFLRCWTLKEAYMKARGEGFSIPPASFSVFHLAGAWSLCTLHPAPGYVGALAVEGRGRRICQYDWQPATPKANLQDVG